LEEHTSEKNLFRVREFGVQVLDHDRASVVRLVDRKRDKRDSEIVAISIVKLNSEVESPQFAPLVA